MAAARAIQATNMTGQVYRNRYECSVRRPRPHTCGGSAEPSHFLRRDCPCAAGAGSHCTMRTLRPSPSMAVAGTALLVSLGGTGYAATQLPPKSVGHAQIRNGAVGNLQIRDNAITTGKIRNGQIQA